jgi:hypothetical protein
MSDLIKSGIVRGDVLPPENRESQSLDMPKGTPMGLGFLGAMRFDAIKRVLTHYEQALRAAALANDAESERNNSLVRRAVSHEQLLNLGTIRQAEVDRIRHASDVAEFRRQIEKLELQTELLQKQAKYDQLNEKFGGTATEDKAKGVFEEALKDIREMPAAARIVAGVKEQIIADRGGEDRLTDADRALLEQIDGVLSAAINKRAEQNLL